MYNTPTQCITLCHSYANQSTKSLMKWIRFFFTIYTPFWFIQFIFIYFKWMTLKKTTRFILDSIFNSIFFFGKHYHWKKGVFQLFFFLINIIINLLVFCFCFPSLHSRSFYSHKFHTHTHTGCCCFNLILIFFFGF